MIVFEVAAGRERVDQLEAGARALGHCDRNGPIQSYNGRWLQPLEPIVELYDPPPVGIFWASGAAMFGPDSRLQSEWTRPRLESIGNKRQGLSDLLLIPAAAVLLFQKHEVAGLVGASLAP